MLEENYNSGNARINVDDLFEKMGQELRDINVNTRHTYLVKVGDSFAAKNNAEGIKQGKRYIVGKAVFHFFKEAEAYDAARVTGGKVIKEGN